MARETPGDSVSIPNPSPHPDPETLMLWESGELDPEATNAIKRHVEECGRCRETVGRFSSMYDDVASVKAMAANWNFHDAMSAKRQEHARKRRSSLQRITVGTAASVLLVFGLGTLFNLTPAAKAEALLLTASEHEAARRSTKNLFKLTNGALQCRMISDATGTRAFPASISSAGFCDSVIGRFRRAGWKSDNLLSVRSFRQWRESLPKKRDNVVNRASTTAITTETEGTSLHKATLELRMADYEPVAAQFEFMPSNAGETEVLRITKSEESFDLTTPAAEPALVSGSSASPSSTPEIPSVAPADLVEAEVRLVLHRLDLDRSVLVAIERKENALKVWGVVPQPQTFSELRDAVASLPQVQFAVASEEDGPLPWRAYQGSGSPLAYDKITALFPNNPQDRQEFINALDLLTRRIVAAARSRERVLALAAKNVSPEQATLLRQAASELQVSMTADSASIAERLQPITDEALVSSAGHMSAARAMDLYTRVHEVVFLGRPDGRLTLEQAVADIRSLLQ